MSRAATAPLPMLSLASLRFVRRTLGAVLAAVAGFGLVSTPSLAQVGGPPPSPMPAVPGPELVRRASAGEAVNLVGVRVEGDVDLRSLDVVARPFRCQSCRLTGSFNAADVIFERTVDLTDSTLEGALDLGASVLKERASFDRARVGGPATLVSTRFLANASFTGADFAGTARFDRTQWAEGAFFGQGSFDDEASFSGAEFRAKADFGQRRFGAGGDFAGAVFGERASFSLADFTGPARFGGVELRRGGSFRLARFRAGGTYDRVAAGGSLEFDGAVIERDTSFDNLGSSGSLSLVGIRLTDANLFMEQLSAQDFSMDVGTVEAVRGRNPQKQILALIERSAQERGELSVANDARYRHLSLASKEHDELVPRMADAVLYRGVAGYLVRPSHPLAALLVLIAAAGLIRSAPGLWSMVGGWARQRRTRAANRFGATMVQRSRHRVLGFEKAVAVVLNGVARSFAVAFRPKPGIAVEDSERVRSYLLAGVLWVEFIACKLLLAISVLALGNSNATIRQLLDAVRG